MRLRGEFSEEELRDIDDALDPFSFEKYCSACMFFGDQEECPYFDKALDDTDWKYDLKCDKFFD